MRETTGKIKSSIEFSLSFLFIFWIVLIIEYIFPFPFYTFGIYPRRIDGLLGILTSPFIHADINHLLANSLPFFVLTSILFFFYGRKAYGIFILIWLSSGFLTWLIGRPSWHIGASSVIYGLASFLIFGGMFSGSFKLIISSLIVIILYSGLIWGIFPTEESVSWEGHLSGAIAGFIWAYIFRKDLGSEDVH